MNPGNLGGEARDNDAAVGVVVHDAAEIFADIKFGVRMFAGGINIGGLVEHEGDALFFDNFIYALKVGGGGHRVRLVAPVARKIDGAIGGANYDGAAAGDRVEHMNKLYR